MTSVRFLQYSPSLLRRLKEELNEGSTLPFVLAKTGLHPDECTVNLLFSRSVGTSPLHEVHSHSVILSESGQAAVILRFSFWDDCITVLRQETPGSFIEVDALPELMAYLWTVIADALGASSIKMEDSEIRQIISCSMSIEIIDPKEGSHVECVC